MERFVKFASIFEPFIGPILDKSVLLSIFVKLEGLNLALCLSNRGVDVENDKLESLKRSFSLSNHTMNEGNDKLEDLNLALCLSNRGMDVENDKLEGLKRSFSLSNHTMNERNVKQGANPRILSRSLKISQDRNITFS